MHQMIARHSCGSSTLQCSCITIEGRNCSLRQPADAGTSLQGGKARIRSGCALLEPGKAGLSCAGVECTEGFPCFINRLPIKTSQSGQQGRLNSCRGTDTVSEAGWLAAIENGWMFPSIAPFIPGRASSCPEESVKLEGQGVEALL